MKSDNTNYGGMRRFRIDRHTDVTGVSGTGCVAQGVVFSDGTTVVRWMSGPKPTTTVHDSVSSVEHIHLHGGASSLRWEDPICCQCGAEIGRDVTPGFCISCGASGSEDYFETRPGTHNWNPDTKNWEPKA